MKTGNKKKKAIVGVRVDMDRNMVEYAKRVNNDKLGTITFLGSRDIDMVEVDFQTDEKTFSKVAEIGRKMIKEDKKKLFGYALVRVIEEVMQKEAKGKKCLRE
jgi:hypothetical protein